MFDGFGKKSYFCKRNQKYFKYKTIKKMKKRHLWMLGAILTCGLLTTSCASEDNPVTPPITMADIVDDFWDIPGNEGDPEVVKALKSIKNVEDLKPFMNLKLGQAYYFNYRQQVDHNDPSKGTFQQQVVLTFAGKDAHTILHTEGYSLLSHITSRNHNRLDSIEAPDLLWQLSANKGEDKKFDLNCVQVEYRYHGFSLPEGDENSFKYLSAKQQSADLHNIVTDLKKALLKGKWLSTGVSKNGMTTYDYAYYYPGDVDVYVPFVAPLLFQNEDMRIGDYMINSAVKDYLPQIKAAFQKLVSDQKVLDATAQYALKYYKEDKSIDVPADSVLHYTVEFAYDHLFGKQSYGDVDVWSKFIPKEGDDPATYALFFYLDENDLRIFRQQSGTRGPLRMRDNPFGMQIPVDQGNIGYNYSWVKEGTLLTDSDKKFFDDKEKANTASDKVELSYLVKDFLKTTDCKMFFVYGENDPWTGAAIDDPTNENVKKMVIKGGTHNDAIPTYTADESKQLMDFVKSILFPASTTK